MTGVLRRFGGTEADTRGRAPWVGVMQPQLSPLIRGGGPQPRRAPRPAHIEFNDDRGAVGDERDN